MAKINKKAAISASQGLPTKEAILTSPRNNDTIPTTVNMQDGSKKPGRLTEGEFVFNIYSIIALGEGDYDQGLTTLTQIHDELSAAGKEMMGESSGETPTGGLGAVQ